MSSLRSEMPLGFRRCEAQIPSVSVIARHEAISLYVVIARQELLSVPVIARHEVISLYLVVAARMRSVSVIARNEAISLYVVIARQELLSVSVIARHEAISLYVIITKRMPLSFRHCEARSNLLVQCALEDCHENPFHVHSK